MFLISSPCCGFESRSVSLKCRRFSNNSKLFGCKKNPIHQEISSFNEISYVRGRTLMRLRKETVGNHDDKGSQMTLNTLTPKPPVTSGADFGRLLFRKGGEGSWASGH
ncbi:hypothetical protein AVEN_70089-1 [Araneus ventricosus]|uniref:Uncharacterized protein n=1 Tax=Araneus ventricosus TaxID=182803 RepID=A0A4Y2H3H5_ARAVE|nr:hypothetical protein AVEN_70089-1 [Araneus ventricosus]